MNKLLVELGENSYPVFIGENILENLGEMLKLYNFSSQVVVITDSNVLKHHGEALTKGRTRLSYGAQTQSPKYTTEL